MLFSVLIPVYNVEQYLCDCLDSVLSQTFSDYEVILVDDGSTDRSSEICDEYADKHFDKVRVIHKENGGLISARRSGIAEANGEYCIFVDSDDMIEINLLEKVRGIIEKYDSPDMVIYSFVYFDGEQKIQRKITLSEDERFFDGANKKELYEALLFTDKITSIVCKGVKTNILRSDPTDYDAFLHKNNAEDALQSLYPLTVSNSVVYINDPLYIYRYNPESVSRNFDYADKNSILKNNTVYFDSKKIEYMKLWGMDDTTSLKRLYSRSVNTVVWLLLKYFSSNSGLRIRDEIVKFDWLSFVTTEMLLCSDDDMFSGNLFKRIWKCIIHKKYFLLKCICMKYDAEMKWKKFKKKCLSK